MSDDLRDKVAEAIFNARGPDRAWDLAGEAARDDHRLLADAAIAAMQEVDQGERDAEKMDMYNAGVPVGRGNTEGLREALRLFDEGEHMGSDLAKAVRAFLASPVQTPEGE